MQGSGAWGPPAPEMLERRREPPLMPRVLRPGPMGLRRNKKLGLQEVNR